MASLLLRRPPGLAFSCAVGADIQRYGTQATGRQKHTTLRCTLARGVSCKAVILSEAPSCADFTRSSLGA